MFCTVRSGGCKQVYKFLHNVHWVCLHTTKRENIRWENLTKDIVYEHNFYVFGIELEK